MAHINREHVKPLAPYILSSTHHFNNQQYQIQTVSNNNNNYYYNHKTRFISCCGCITALLLIFLVIIIVLGFTVYNVKEPEVKLFGINLLNNGTFITTTKDVPNGITTLVADVSLKNTNDFTFKFGNTTTIIYYDGIGIGEGITVTPPRKVKAKRTIRFNVTMKIMNSPSFMNDTRDQALNFSTYTRIDGKVRILELFNKRVVVELNCTIEYNFTTPVSHGNNCLSNVDI